MPKARRPPTLATPSPPMATSTTVAETTEPVTTSRTTQHAATPPAIAQRLRLRCRSGARACRRAASLPSLIEYHLRSVLDSSVTSDRLIRPDLPVPVTEDAGSAPVSQRIAGSFQTSGSCQRAAPGPWAERSRRRLGLYWRVARSAAWWPWPASRVRLGCRRLRRGYCGACRSPSAVCAISVMGSRFSGAAQRAIRAHLRSRHRPGS